MTETAILTPDRYLARLGEQIHSLQHLPGRHVQQLY